MKMSIKKHDFVITKYCHQQSLNYGKIGSTIVKKVN